MTLKKTIILHLIAASLLLVNTPKANALHEVISSCAFTAFRQKTSVLDHSTTVLFENMQKYGTGLVQQVLQLNLTNAVSFNGTGNPEVYEENFFALQIFEMENSSMSQPAEELSLKQKIVRYYQQSSIKVKVLMIVLLYLLLSIFMLFFLIVINRYVKTRRRERLALLKNEYQEQLAGFLFDEDVDRIVFRGLNSSVNRQVLINVIHELHTNLHGESAGKLRDLYFNLKLHEDSLKKAYHRKWYKKAKGFREVAQMDVKDANKHISKYVNAKNPILRVDAQVAMVKLSEEDPLDFLYDLKYELSEWEQINIYDTLIYHQINIESFEPWLDNRNQSVVVFALKMIALFKHVQSAPRVKELLFHGSAQIRLTAVKTIKALEIAEYKADLKKLFEVESDSLEQIVEDQKKNKKEKEADNLDDLLPRKIRQSIVEAMEPVADDSDFDFLSEIAMNKENSFIMRVVALKIMANITPSGVLQLDKLEQEAQDDDTLKNMIVNIKQNPES